MEDTIAAISTPIGEGGIAIVRLSGPRATGIADAIYLSPRGRVADFPSHTVHFGTIGQNGEMIDQVMLTVMRAPKTYTAEDVVEINCHGGLLTAKNILAQCLKNGARLAEPGEFTKRAFLNGRIDLTQAEAVMDLIGAKTNRAHTAAVHALEGHLSKRLDEARERLITVLAHIEATIDFPEDDLAADTREKWLTDTTAIMAFLNQLLATAQEGRILRQGIAVAIIGRPNAGKSSLMNALLGQDRSIVTPVAGTTRDTIEETANIRGIPIRLTDTAGIRKPRGTVEHHGINRSRKSLATSDLILHVLDGSRAFSKTDLELSALYEGKPAVQVLNKHDLPRKLVLPAAFPKCESVGVSSLRGDGIEQLKDKIEAIAWSGRVGSADVDVAINERQADAIQRSLNSLTTTTATMNAKASQEIISQELRIALDAIGEIVGKTATEDILAKIFSTFCIGK